jgi:hypothetical protein
MSASASVQGAIVARLKGYAPLTAKIGSRVYDQVPASGDFPYVTLGPGDAVPVVADCYRGSDETLQVDAWSRSPAWPEVKVIAGLIEAALVSEPLVLTGGYRAVDLSITTTYIRDADNLTNHAAVTVTVQTEPV